MLGRVEGWRAAPQVRPICLLPVSVGSASLSASQISFSKLGGENMSPSKRWRAFAKKRSLAPSSSGSRERKTSTSGMACTTALMTE